MTHCSVTLQAVDVIHVIHVRGCGQVCCVRMCASMHATHTRGSLSACVWLHVDCLGHVVQWSSPLYRTH